MTVARAIELCGRFGIEVEHVRRIAVGRFSADARFPGQPGEVIFAVRDFGSTPAEAVMNVIETAIKEI